ncbi:hypothetical protein N798_01135 [Knoellia flava TL1]|uniref:Uncharacterized protein n=1 Tax=Knoellia flava TL1 TaxID=1385518 RepID=A0ABR4XJD4_9MICO|nr:hypothetical protein N798_01135 [Knoellia flava TL1]
MGVGVDVAVGVVVGVTAAGVADVLAVSLMVVLPFWAWVL